MKSPFLKKNHKLIFGILLGLFLVSVPFNIVKHFNSDNAFIDGYFVNYLDFVIHIIDIAVLLLVVWMFFACTSWHSSRLRVWLLSILIFYFFHNLLFRDTVVLYFSTRVALYLFCAVLLFFNNSMDRYKTWIWCIPVIGACVQSLIAILQFYLGRNLGIGFLGESAIQVGGYAASSVVLPGGIELRGYGTFPHPNVLGVYLVSVLLITLFVYKKVKPVYKILLVCSSFLISIGVLVTWSRSAWIMILLISIFWLIRKLLLLINQGSDGFKRVKTIVISTCAVLILFCGWIWVGRDNLSRSIYQRLLTQTSATDMSVVERGQLMESAVSMIKEYPIFGVGIGNFIPELSKNPVYTGSGLRLMQPVHNIFMLIIAEAGVMGIGLIIGLFYFLVEAIKKYGLGCYVVPAAIILIVAGSVDHYFWTLPQGLGILLNMIINGKILVQSINNSNTNEKD